MTRFPGQDVQLNQNSVVGGKNVGAISFRAARRRVRNAFVEFDSSDNLGVVRHNGFEFVVRFDWPTASWVRVNRGRRYSAH